MYNFVLFLIISVSFFENSTQNILTKTEFVCDINKCICERSSNQNLPLYKVDCSRLNFGKCPQKDNLPKLLGHLDLSHNKIHNLNESQFVSSTLYYLDISYNNIKLIHNKAFTNSTNLIFLHLNHNYIVFLDKNLFNGLEHLKIVNLQSNYIKSISEGVFKNLPSLEQLILSYTDVGPFLEQQQLSELLPKSLTELYLQHINIHNVSRSMFENMEHLKKLSFAHNPILELPYLPLPNLEYLDISGTRLTNLTSNNLMFPYLKILKMNRLPYITIIYDYAFFNLHKLEELYIEHCTKLEKMHPMAFGHILEKESPNHMALKKFSIEYSGLKSLPDTYQFIFEDLKEINLRGNIWHCNCDIKWFLKLNKNLKHIEDIRCASPNSQANKTIVLMSEDEFLCLVKTESSTYIPIQAWLFPLIGALTVIIFILIAILIYMGPYGQNIYKMEGKIIGPDSPYNPVTICPNEAENLKT